MKKNLLLIYFIAASSICFAQTAVYYHYDAAGNRIDRKLVPRLDESTPPKTVQDYGVSVYPNPASDNLIVDILNLQPGDKATVFIFDEAGKKVFEKKQDAVQQSIGMKEHPAGMYYLKIRINEDEMTYKVLKVE